MAGAHASNPWGLPLALQEGYPLAAQDLLLPAQEHVSRWLLPQSLGVGLAVTRVPKHVSMVRAEVEQGSLEGDWWLHRYHMRDLSPFHLWLWDSGSQGMPLAATTGQDGCNTLSHPANFRALLSGPGSSMQGVSGKLVRPGVCRLSFSSSSGRATPLNTSSLVKERYHLTSSLNSRTLFANRWGSPLLGGLFCSAQYWRALAYATTFSLGISQISLHAKMESAGGKNFFWQRHGSAGEPRGWPPLSPTPTYAVEV